MTVAALELKGLGKDYGPLRALDTLSLEIAPGEVYGLLGPNGAGKTTTLRLILGFLTPDRGDASVFGVEVHRSPVKAREFIGYLPGDIRFESRLTGSETLEYLGRLRPTCDRRYREQLVEAFAFDPSKRVREYSKGNRQKLGIIAALQHRPLLALLDEPTSGLDPLMQRRFYDVVAELAAAGSAVLFSSHVLTEVAQVCGRVGVLRRGELVVEKPVTALARETVRRVEVVFAPPVPAESELCLPGTFAVERHGDRYVACLEGSPDDLIKALAPYTVRDVVVERPDVEDLFMRYYREEGQDVPVQ